MNAQAWKNTIGESAWNHITSTISPQGTAGEAHAAAVLTRATEVGFLAPTGQPTVAPSGTKILVDAGDGRMVPVLTAAGLERHWANRGHGFLVLRGAQLMRAVAGSLFPWLQVILQAYEDQCAKDHKKPIPADWRVFVGGKGDEVDNHRLVSALMHESPMPNPNAIQRIHIAGPGSR